MIPRQLMIVSSFGMRGLPAYRAVRDGRLIDATPTVPGRPA